MSRACKCRYCQKNITTDIAHLEHIKDKKAYFCNEEHYVKFLSEAAADAKNKEHSKQLQDKFYNLMCEILGVNGITNTALWKEKTEINNVFPDEVIVAYWDENKSWITSSVSKLSGGIYGKIRYVSVILRNKLGDYKPKVIVAETEKPKIVVDNTFYETMQTRNNKRRSLSDLEDEL